MAGFTEMEERQERLDEGGVPQEPQSEDDGKVIKLIRELFDIGKDLNETLARIWMKSLAYLSGQKISWNDRQRRWNPVREAVPHRRHYDVPLVQSYWLRAKAFLSQGKVEWETIPASTSQEDIDRKVRADAILQDVVSSDKIKFHEKMDRVLGWTKALGTGFMHLRWDSDKGEMEPPEILSPLEVLWDTLVEDIEESSWAMKIRWTGRKWIEEHYPDKLEELDGQTTTDSGMSFPYQYVGLANSFGQGSPQSPSDVGDGYLVFEYWERPSDKHPKGRLIVVCSDVVLFQDENPLHFLPTLPFYPMYEFKLPGQRYGSSRMPRLIDLNIQYDKARSQMIEHQNLFGHPTRWIPTVCEVDLKDLNSEPMNVPVKLGPRGEHPQTEQAPPMSAAQVQNLELILRDFREASQISESSLGMNPSNVRSAVHAATLKESDLGALNGDVNEIMWFLRKVGKAILMMYGRFLKSEKVFTMTMPGGVRKDYNIRGKDLFVGSSPEKYFNVVVERSSLTPRSKVAIRNEMAFMVQMGLLNPAADRHKMARALDHSIHQDILGVERGERQLASYENDLMESQPTDDNFQPSQERPADYQLEPEDCQDDDIHIFEHERREKEPSFYFKHPLVKMRFAYHKMKHRMAKVSKMMREQSLMMPAMGQQSQQQMLMGPGGQPQGQQGPPPGPPAPAGPRNTIADTAGIPEDVSPEGAMVDESIEGVSEEIGADLARELGA